MTLNHKSIEEAYNLINKKIIKTPLVSNDYINNLSELKSRFSNWQLKAFEESYKSKVETGLSLIKKKLAENRKN